MDYYEANLAREGQEDLLDSSPSLARSKQNKDFMSSYVVVIMSLFSTYAAPLPVYFFGLISGKIKSKQKTHLAIQMLVLLLQSLLFLLATFASCSRMQHAEKHPKKQWFGERIFNFTFHFNAIGGLIFFVAHITLMAATGDLDDGVLKVLFVSTTMIQVINFLVFAASKV